jgi:MYXO-CTERM domain-containing protein
MTKRLHILLIFAATLFAAGPALADAGDMGMSDAGMDAGTGDAGMDAGMSDAGVSDMGMGDAGSSDAGATDAGTVDMSADAMFDAGLDSGAADAGLDASGPTFPDSFTISGSAVLSTSEAATIEVVLLPTDGAPRTDFTDGAGRFEFRDVQPGTYDVTVSYSGFVTQSRALDVVADRRLDFVLFPDVTFDVRVDVAFVDGGGPITLTARSLGREIVVESDETTVDVALGAGPWDVTITSPGYVPANLSFTLAADRDPDRVVTMVALMERRATPEVTTEGGCSCSQGGAAPDGALLLVVGIGALAFVRRRWA